MTPDLPPLSPLPHFAAPRSRQSSDEWYTPKWLTDALGRFDLDPATSEQRVEQVAPTFFTADDDGLERHWLGRVWLNPPFSKIQPWVERMRAHNNGIMLCFSRTEAKWFVDLTRHCGAVYLLRGRVQFWRPGDGPKKQACPMGTVLFPFGPQNVAHLERCGLPGVLMRVHP